MVLLILMGASLPATAAGVDKSRLPPAAAGTSDFARDIEPIFARACHACHGPNKQKGGYRLDDKAAAMKGGDNGAAILAGQSADSPLIHYVSGLVEEMLMPQKGERLTDAQIGLLRAWIDQGALWPAGPAAVPKETHWAFRPPNRPVPPEVKNGRWPRNPIDHFILARLEKAQLAPAPEADRRTLIRRLSYDLIGLPPSPEEAEAFARDRHGDAYEKLVERLLASPRYGERWARHWLDAVRFAESNGFETNLERKNAWPYRDYVVQAFNQDKPYNQFIMEQLAGDALGADVATGFIVAGPWDAVKSPDVQLTAQQRMDELHDMVSTTGSAFLGLTVGCARCHDHKFDPISQRDYYAMQAVFTGVQHGERTWRPPDCDEKMKQAEIERAVVAGIEDQIAPFYLAQAADSALKAPHPRLNMDSFPSVEARYVRFTIERTSDGAEPCLDELEIYTAGEHPRNVARASAGGTASASGTFPNSALHKLEHINDGRTGNSYSWISNERGQGWVQIEFREAATINKILWGRDREEKYSDRLAIQYRIEVGTVPGQWRLAASSSRREPYAATAKPAQLPSIAGVTKTEADQLARLLAEKREAQERLDRLMGSAAVYAGKFEQPGPTYRLHRGDPLQQREPVAPGVLSGIGSTRPIPDDATEQQRRLALARWIAEAQNPLTARVLVNRLWQHHFGAGLVTTPSDFGRMGGSPSHPELLDWLATEFVARAWSIKEMQRLILLSSAYRQSSRPETKAMAQDASNALLWRFPPQRLEAEAIRDSILWASGKLDLKMGGPGFDLFEPNSNYVKVYNSKTAFGPAEWRRMVYQSKPRNQLDNTFGVFDCPDGAQIAPRRSRSTTPLQALNLLNSPFLLQQAGFFAERLQREAGPYATAQTRRAFWLALGREPAPAELAAGRKVIAEHGLTVFCRALFNANEFVYVY
ncbi:MAG: DUF1553 domain-containing protein [Chloroflexi bacterium]|nr:DUF1553 domain-containing protein [Chloroflexota bacterium]